MRGYFITGTGTDIGKTWLTCALIRQLRAQGMCVQVGKPVMSGFDEATMAASDAGQLLAAVGEKLTPANLDAISPWRFSAARAPDEAARLEGRTLDFDALIKHCRTVLAEPSDITLIEGAGGVMTPITAQHTVRDWVAALDTPPILVTGSYLGAISHTLTALAALREVGVKTALVVVNAQKNTQSANDIPCEETVVSLSARVDVPVVGISHEAPDDGLSLCVSQLIP